MKRFCGGCGIALQTGHSDLIGYVRPQDEAKGLCQRCFKINHYGEFHKVDITNEQIREMINRFDKQKDLVTLVVDLSDLHATCLLELSELLHGRHVIVVVNKLDIIMPEQRHQHAWKRYIAQLFDTHELVVEQIFFVSAKERLSIKALIAYYQASQYQNIRMIGCANVGKSSLIQALSSKQVSDHVMMPTVFQTPGTTLAECRIPWGAQNLYDTPGVMQYDQLLYYASPKAIKAISLQKPIRPKHYQIYEAQTFFIGGYAQIDLIPEARNTVSFFVANTVPIHRRKLVCDDTFYRTHLGSLLAPPTLDELATNPQLSKRAKHDFTLYQNKQDIVISGLGWVSLTKAPTTVQVSTVAGVKVYVQPALV